MQSLRPPRNRDDIRVAIMCALVLEAEMVRSMFNIDWLHKKIDLGQEEDDNNAYSVGTIGRHHVVLVHLAGTGNHYSAISTANVKRSYRKIEVMFAVGVCGAAPVHPDTGCEIVLGDTIISTAVNQIDLGRRYPDYILKKGGESVFSESIDATQAWIRMLQLPLNLEKLSSQCMEHIQALNDILPQTRYPGSHEDRLYVLSHIHKHHTKEEQCESCLPNSMVCRKDCSLLGCGKGQLLPRSRFSGEKSYIFGVAHKPQIHFGIFGSTQTVTRDGKERDIHTAMHKTVAYEVGGAAGSWETLPTVVVKSASNYADGHKNKNFRIYAAATAAAMLKSILEFWKSTESYQYSVGDYSDWSPVTTASDVSTFKRDTARVDRGIVLANYLDQTADEEFEEFELGE